MLSVHFNCLLQWTTALKTFCMKWIFRRVTWIMPYNSNSQQNQWIGKNAMILERGTDVLVLTPPQQT